MRNGMFCILMRTPTYGERCKPPTSSNGGSSRSDTERGPWSASSMWISWTELSTLDSRDPAWNGKLAPSARLRKQLDVTGSDGSDRGGRRPVGNRCKIMHHTLDSV